jgi:RNA polymerase sigma factor (TIGR02999 family)
MDERSQTTFSVMLLRARQGDADAVGGLFSLAYDQLKTIARTQRQRQREETLNTTALVHEAFIKLASNENLGARDRSHFMAIAAMAMRQILIDHARHRLADKRGGGHAAVSFNDIEEALESGYQFSDVHAHALLALDNSLTRLAGQSERQSRVVECRFFGGLSIEETADALGMSSATVKRDWALAQAWLYRDLNPDAA